MHTIRNVMSISRIAPRSLAFTRHLAWNAFLKPNPLHRPPPSSEDSEDTKDAILEKVMKSRLPSDLMLRCEWPTLSRTFSHPRS